jgi:hypothetical protein
MPKNFPSLSITVMSFFCWKLRSCFLDDPGMALLDWGTVYQSSDIFIDRLLLCATEYGTDTSLFYFD